MSVSVFRKEECQTQSLQIPSSANEAEITKNSLRLRKELDEKEKREPILKKSATEVSCRPSEPQALYGFHLSIFEKREAHYNSHITVLLTILTIHVTKMPDHNTLPQKATQNDPHPKPKPDFGQGMQTGHCDGI